MKYAYKGIEIHPSVEIYHDVIVFLAGITMREFFKDKAKCAQAWHAGLKKIYEYFGDILPLRAVSGPPISYGHIICLGSPVTYPENSEPNVKPVLSSIDEGIELLEAKKDIDYSEQPLFKHYYEMCNYLKDQFPDQNVHFSGMGAQGPLTSAVLIRGQDFIYDVYDEPEKAKRFLALLTDSIVGFHHFTNKVNGMPAINPRSAGLADDFASLISPDMWPEFVVPYWNQYFEGLTTGTRTLHCENLAPAHLKYLKDIHLSHFQPSVSDLLTIENVKANTSIPFDWLLYAYNITEMSDKEIEQWVDRTVEAGITIIRTQFGQYTCQADKLDRIKAFYKAFEKYRI
ncbi:MAG TPA: uroporphyrinogen decarboxylase family protein [Clostridiales bacterium]|nr:uroporphyrinogen decarboxylase family protein [Clostridiales bacterium]